MPKHGRANTGTPDYTTDLTNNLQVRVSQYENRYQRPAASAGNRRCDCQYVSDPELRMGHLFGRNELSGRGPGVREHDTSAIAAEHVSVHFHRHGGIGLHSG